MMRENRKNQAPVLGEAARFRGARGAVAEVFLDAVPADDAAFLAARAGLLAAGSAATKALPKPDETLDADAATD